MRNNLFKNCLQSHCSDNGDQRLLSRVWRKSWNKSRKNSLWHPGYIVHFMPSQQSRTPLPYHVKLFRDFFFRAPYDRRKILVTELRTVPG